jgi:hypothetical protein
MSDSGSLGNPHDDQRSLAFLNNDTILETDDGGIYGLPDVQDFGNNPHWVALNENIQDTEFFQIAYDSQDGVIFGGAQDNGSPVQSSPGSGIPSWTLTGGSQYGGGDGGDVAVDNSGSESKYYFFTDGVFETHSISKL